MTHIDLDRRFIKWNNDIDPERWSLLYAASDQSLTWADLLKKLRAVVLAEGGSGKSEEFAHQAEQLIQAGKFAWNMKVLGIARLGVEGSMHPADQERFRRWRESDEEAWFLVDSVDEARLNQETLEDCLTRMAQALYGAERRAHVVLSSRHSDWEPVTDLQRFNRSLPVPREPVDLGEFDPDANLLKLLEKGREAFKPAPDPEPALVVLLLPLDQSRVRRFAQGKRLVNATQFIEAIDAAHLWEFARRPLDVGWLLDYWQRYARLGSLTEMIQTSLEERLKEPSVQRDRRSPLDGARGMQALERVGAALVFGKAVTLQVPDSALRLLNKDAVLNADDVLFDYPGPERGQLLSRPVFDPATFERIRLHNDNLGVVRALLAARWLVRLRKANLSTRELRSLLFAEEYGVKVVIPSARETAAWLATWEPTVVGQEIAKRGPWVLLTGGDPGSLKLQTRIAVLHEVAQRVADPDYMLPQLDDESVRRFLAPDLAPTIRRLWGTYPQNEVRRFLLRLIWWGQLQGCADLAAEVAMSTEPDIHLRTLAGRAAAVGKPPLKRRYVWYLLDHLAEVRPAMAWNALEDLFPTSLDVDALLTITGTLDVTDSGETVGFGYLGPQLMERVTSKPDIERLLGGLLNQLGGATVDFGHLKTAREEAYQPSIATLACELLRRSGPNEAPALAIDAAVRLGQDESRRSGSWKSVQELPAMLLNSSARRRTAFWGAAVRLRQHPLLEGKLEETYRMQMLSWDPRLKPEDLEWLLEDGPKRTEVSERRLSISAALEVIWKEPNRAEPIERIRKVAVHDPDMLKVFEGVMTPRERTAEERERDAEFAELRARNEAQRREAHQTWLDFVKRMRADPTQLRNLNPTTATTADARLIGLWQLLDRATGGNRYSIDNLAPAERIFGKELTEELRTALIGFWRTWAPRPASDRGPTERNQVSSFDCAGVTGIALEAQSDPAWATKLNAQDVSRAAVYATLEINGFPTWVERLAQCHPDETRDVLKREVMAELESAPSERGRILQSVVHGALVVKQLLSSDLLEYATAHPEIATNRFPDILQIVSAAADADTRSRAKELTLARTLECEDVEQAANYASAAFALDAEAAFAAVDRRFGELTPANQTLFVEQLLPLLFGDRASPLVPAPKDLPFSCLLKLVQTAYATVRMEEDVDRASGVVYSPERRDRAQWARDAAFKRLADQAGRATYEALLQLAALPALSSVSRHLLALALQRAETDAEHEPWAARGAQAYEHHKQAAPRTPRDLQRMALNRLGDIQDDLPHHDFAQGKTLKLLPDEKAVQNWVAAQLEHLRKESYSVERESHVAEEKEPDIRLRAKQSDASLSMEVKVAESWTYAELVEALVGQLVGQYLRAKDARHGILLLVHLEARPIGWHDESGAVLNFPALCARLSAMADEIAARSPDSPQPLIAVLDASDVSVTKGKPRKKRSAKKKKSVRKKTTKKNTPTRGGERVRGSRTRGGR